MKGKVGKDTTHIVAPPKVLRGEEVRKALDYNIAVASAIGEFIKPTYGPRGMKKLITMRDKSGWSPTKIDTTSDGNVILNSIEFRHPIGKMMANMSKVIDDEVGDGSKTAVLIACKLLEEAKRLIDQGLHPITIAKGYRKARDKAVQMLESIAFPIELYDERTLRKIAATAMCSKLPIEVVQHPLISILIEAIERITEEGWKLDLENIKIEKQRGGSLSESVLLDGFIMSYPMCGLGTPMRIKDAKIALIASPMELMSMGDRSKWGQSLEMEKSKPGQLGALDDKRRNIIRGMVDKITSCGANVVVCRVGADDFAFELFEKRGVLACKRVLMPDMMKIQKAAGGELIWDLDKLTPKALAEADSASIEKVGGREYFIISGCRKLKAISILVRGNRYLVDEAERAMRDGFCVIKDVLKDPRVILGSGAAEVRVAIEIEKYSTKIDTREQLAVKAFAKALEAIPMLLARNAGLDSVNTIIKLRTMHMRNEGTIGIDAFKGISDAKDLGIYEPFSVKLQAINSACEIVERILLIDQSISAKQKKLEKPLTPEKVEKLERSMLPKVMEETEPEYKERWRGKLLR